MEHIISLPEYDTIAYLVAGLAALAAADLIFGTRTFFRADWSISVTTTVVIVALAVGHVVALLSALLIENYGVNAFTSPPTTYLMEKDTCRQQSRLPIQYFSALDCSTQQKINDKLGREERTKDLKGSNLFWEAYNNAKQNDYAFKRIVTFHEQYNFSRNMSFVALLAAITILFRGKRGVRLGAAHAASHEIPKWVTRRWPLFAAFLFIGVVFFARYLYFYRAHSIEVLTSYAYAVEGDKKSSAEKN